jgi:23S rRNA pseudouridine1911/1915/1917 synthase
MVSLRNYLKEKYPELSNVVIKKSLEMGACTVNGKVERYASREVNPQKDKIGYRKIKEVAIKPLLIDKARIVFEDEYLLVYDKEGYYPSTETSSKNQIHLLGELKKQLKLRKLYAVHRLDKGTSGLIIFVKDQETSSKFNEMFIDKEIKKEYLALMDGVLPLNKSKTLIDNELVLIDRNESSQKWGVKGKNTTKPSRQAITELELVKAYKDYSYVKLRPFTGRTHQLRVHAAYLGHPILGDTVYGEKFRCKKIFDRHLLHAYKLSFKHPVTGVNLQLISELPDDFKKMVEANLL